MFRDWYIALLPAAFVGTVSWVGYYLSEALNYPLALQTLTHHNLGPNFAFIIGAIAGLLFAVACRVDLLLRAEEE